MAAFTTLAPPDLVPPEEGIATFDYDGTLWTEQPPYAQLAFALDRLKARPSPPACMEDERPYKAILQSDMRVLVPPASAQS